MKSEFRIFKAVIILLGLIISEACSHRVKIFIPETREDGQYLLYKAFSSGNKSNDYTQGKFLYPLSGGQIVTSPFGVKRANNRLHEGVDLKASLNTKVRAINSGRIVLAARLSREGLIMVIDHGLDTFSIYMHLSEVLVKEDDRVKNGQAIALSGDTGEEVTGPHLHLGVRLDGKYVDPLIFIKIANKYKERKGEK